MNIAYVASEATPYAKTGGLADVVGSLPKYLNTMGIKTRTFLPKYKGIKGSLSRKLSIDMHGLYNIKVFKEGDVYFIDYPEFFERDFLYGTENGDYPDNCERFTLFCKTVAQLLADDDCDIVHCHDWQSAMIPLYLQLKRTKIKSVFTIHNIGYQGKFPGSQFPILGIDEKYFNPEGVEFYGDINFLKAGILYSDIVTTVSENYAKEIQTPAFGFGLDGVLKERSDDVFGIINGIDYNIWNPQSDNFIYEKYNDFTGKMENKMLLTKELNIDPKRPLIGMVSRMAQQKGFDILVKAFDKIVKMNFNFVLLGFGEDNYHIIFKKFEESYPNWVSMNIKFDNKLAHRIYAGSDFFLMPSMYEPCGLGQLISLKYGTVPIVRKIGGLADTVEEFNPETRLGNGFLFEKYSPEDLINTLTRARAIYNDHDTFKVLSETCMGLDFSWKESAKKYEKLYESILTRSLKKNFQRP